MTPREREVIRQRINVANWRRRQGIQPDPRKCGTRVHIDSEHLRALIASSGMTIYMVEAGSDLSRGALNNMLRRGKGCCWHTAERLAEALQVHPSAFVTDWEEALLV